MTLSSASAFTLCTNESYAGYTPHANWKSCHTRMPSSVANEDIDARSIVARMMTLTITGVIEYIWLVDASAPESDHVLIPVSKKGKPIAIPLWSELGEEAVRRDPV